MNRILLLRSLYFFCFITLLLDLASAEIRSIGVPRFPKDLRIIADNEATSLFFKSALTRTLVRPIRSADGSISYELDVATGFSTDGKFSRVSFSLPDKAIFSDGDPIEFDDLQYSISQCRLDGRFQNVGEVIEKERIRGGLRSRILEVSLSKQGVDEYKSVLQDFSNCPLLDAKSSKIFGSQLGQGNALIPSGKFKIASFKAGSEYSLVRWEDAKLEPQEIVIKVFFESDQALSMLRSGAFDIIVGVDEDAVEKARSDKTLAVVMCPQGVIVYRNGLSFQCDPRLTLDSLIYTDVPS